jgi:ubiquinone/menaquinone biosynthesis C-methylase UbiE
MDELQKLEERLKIIDGGVMLDVATGRGEFLHSLMESLKSYDKAVAIDNSERAIAAVKERFTETSVDVREMDAAKMDFPNEHFDTVAISNSLHHFDQPEAVLSEMMRVLKPGGYILISEMHCDEGQTDAQKSHILAHHWWSDIDSKLGIVHHKTLTTDEIAAMLNQLNLSKSECYEFSYPENNPRDEEKVTQLINATDMYLERIKNHEDYEELKQRGEELKERFREVGFAPAARFFFIGKKKVDVKK